MNQRSKEKEQIGGYHPRALKRALLAIAKREGKTLVQLQAEMFTDGIRRRGERIPKAAVAE